MRAIRIHAFGDGGVLRLDEVSKPGAGEGEVLVKVEAASVNPVDAKIREGKYPAVKPDMLPYVLGRDVAGVVEKLGPGASRFQLGEPVFAYIGIERGGYAEYVVSSAAEAARKPQAMSMVEAAATPLAGITAWQGLFDHGELSSGQRVLIHGGAGGVGHLAIQFAKARGAWVATTASAADLDFVRGIGADLAIDYKAERFEDKLGDLDLVFDLIAGETQDRSWGVLKRGGALISTLAQPSEEKAKAHGVRAARYTAAPNAGQLGEIGRLVERGEVKVSVARTFPLSEARAAQDFLEHEHVRGKVVLTVD